MKLSMTRLAARPWIWSYLGALALWVTAITLTHGHGAGGMLTAALALSVFTVIAGLAQMFVVTLGPGNVDLSLPANIGLSSAVAMTVMNGCESMIAAGLLAALACGMATGVANFLLIWALRIPPIIATLSASFVLQSIDISYGRGLQIKPPPGFANFTSVQIFGVPVLAVLTVVLASAAALILQRTLYGRSVLAIGQNLRAARFAGLPVEWTRMITYALSGTLGGLDGTLLAGYFRGANIDIGDEYLLSSIAVVVIGGTSVAGGRANVPGVWGAALFLVLLLTMLNTSGVGVISMAGPCNGSIAPSQARPGDVVILSGTIGDHGMAILSVREGLEFETILRSDTAPLNGMVESLLRFAPHLHVLRDPTRGGLASSLNEIAGQSKVGILIDERKLPILPDVQSACDLLGMDPIYVANEGKLVAIVEPGCADDMLRVMHESPYGRDAAIIGTVTAQHAGILAAKTAIGGTRVIPLQIGEQIPRIC